MVVVLVEVGVGGEARWGEESDPSEREEEKNQVWEDYDNIL